MIYFFLIAAFILGAVIGSGLNVCIARIPYERSIIWPSSRCDTCFTPIRKFDNVPLFSYWLLRGKCRSCGQQFSSQHFWVELLTAFSFAGLFYADIIVNVHGYRELELNQFMIRFGKIPFQFWMLWISHIILVSFLIIISMTDFLHMEIPLSVTMTGTLVGIILSMIFAWPYPSSETATDMMVWIEPTKKMAVPHVGLQLWPIWATPDWLPKSTWQMGLLTSLAGIFAAMILLRMIRFLFSVGRGIEGLGLGDADVMMMVGAFLGWQAVVVAFFVSVIPGLFLGIFQAIFRGSQLLAFGPCLALGTLITMLGWRWLPAHATALFFNETIMITLGLACGVFLLLISFLLRLGRPPQQMESNTT